MRILFSLFFISLTLGCFAQLQKSEIRLTPIDIKKKEIPFYIQNVQFQLSSDTIATVYSKKKKGTILFTLPQKNKESTFTTFFENQYTQNKDGAPISMIVKKLEVTPIKKGEFNPKDQFQFECDFIKGNDPDQDLLYTFRAKNEFGTFEDAETVLNNYVTRVLNSAIEQFKATFNNRVDWQEDYTKGKLPNSKPIKVNCVYNKINSSDSVACTSQKKIDWSLFQENKKAKNENGNAKYVLTYKALSEETSKQLKLDIYVYSFLNKKLSWKPEGTQNENWLAYQQGLFDISSIFGLRLQKEMKNHTYSLGEYRTELNKIYNDLMKEYLTMTKQYSEETKNGSLPDKMKEWISKIGKMNNE